MCILTSDVCFVSDHNLCVLDVMYVLISDVCFVSDVCFISDVCFLCVMVKILGPM